MRSIIIFLFIVFHFVSFSQKVTLTPIVFNKGFTLEKVSTNSVLKDYTQFSQSPFKKIPNGFTLSDAFVFSKFDTLNCSLFIRKREDRDGMYFYRDCEDGRYCMSDSYGFYEDVKLRFKNAYIKYELAPEWEKGLIGCCDELDDFDTTALFFNNEMVDFVDFISFDHNLPSSLVSNQFVTNKEYREFIDYCIDSMNRFYLAELDTTLIFNAKFGEGPINYSRKYNPNEKKYQPYLESSFYYPHERFQQKKSRDSRKIIFSLTIIPRTFFIGKNNCSHCRSTVEDDECSLGKKQCSNTRINYTFSQVENERQRFYRNGFVKNFNKDIIYSLPYLTTSIYPDTLSWITKNYTNVNSIYLIWASENYFNQKKYANLPVQGVNYWQARSFLEWKTFFHNRELRRQQKNYRVLYTFPLPEEVTTNEKLIIITPKIDFEKYIITNAEYESFVIQVVDSIICKRKIDGYSGRNTKVVWDKLAIKTYDMDGYENDIYYWFNNKKSYSRYFLKTKKYLQETDSLFPLYEEMFVPEYCIDYLQYDGFDTRKIWFDYSWMNYDSDSLQQKKDLYLITDGYLNYSHVYGVEDRSEYIIREKLNIFPGYDVKDMSKLDESLLNKNIKNFYSSKLNKGLSLPDSLNIYSDNFVGNYKWELDTVTEYKVKFYDFKKSPNEPITAITYEQAKAYYYWKNEVPYVPTKEEWTQIQKGINPYEVKELEVPGPFFRYAIRVYPVREEER